MAKVMEFIRGALHISNTGKLTRRAFLTKLTGYLFYIIVLVIVYCLIRDDLLKDETGSLVRTVISSIPFAKSMFPSLLKSTNSILKQTIDYSGEVKSVTEQFAAETIFLSLCKVLFMVWVTPFFDLFVTIIQDLFKNTGKLLGGIIESLCTPVTGLLKLLEFLVRFLLVYAIFDPLKEALNSFDPTAAMVLALILFILLFLLVGVCRTFLDGGTVERGLVKSYLVDIIPGLLEVFVSNSLCLVLYYFWIVVPFGWQPKVFYVVLLLWYCVIVPILKALIKKAAEHLPNWKSSSVSIGQFILWVLCCFATTILMYVMILINLWDTETAELLSLSSFPFTFGIQLNQIPLEQITTSTGYFWPNLLTLIVISIVVALLLKKPLLRGLPGMALYVCIWAGVVLLASVCTNILMNWLLAWDMNLETNRYNGWYGIIFFILLVILLLYNYQVVVTAAFTAVLVVLAISAWMYTGQVNFAFMSYSDTRCMLAMMVVVFSMSALGAVTYGIRKK